MFSSEVDKGITSWRSHWNNYRWPCLSSSEEQVNVVYPTSRLADIWISKWYWTVKGISPSTPNPQHIMSEIQQARTLRIMAYVCGFGWQALIIATVCTVIKKLFIESCAHKHRWANTPWKSQSWSAWHLKGNMDSFTRKILPSNQPSVSVDLLIYCLMRSSVFWGQISV